ncbi:uncharacterized protein LOC143247326 [Tachypleus tridentatus]|uniref:uncharacterized protein LOC143247326 n=1 Tax=Tachypleus tridentatus TaxID=6853 RepID=UPI003FD0FA12
MAEQRRSIRARKSVNYEKFSGGGSDEDDFTYSSTPPTKKSKTEKNGRLNNLKKEKQKENDSSQSIPVESKVMQNMGKEHPHQRLSISDKVFQRHLETAIQISNRENKSVVSDNKKETVNENHTDKDYLDEEKDKRSAKDLDGEVEGPSPKCFRGKKTEKNDLMSKKGLETDTDQNVSISKSTSSKYSSVLINPSTRNIPSPGLRPSGKLVKLPATGLKIGLSRKAVVKPLHSSVKV